jgi:hypothetical protein
MQIMTQALMEKLIFPSLFAAMVLVVDAERENTAQAAAAASEA